MGYEDTENYQGQGRLHDKDHHNHVYRENDDNVSNILYPEPASMKESRPERRRELVVP